MIKDNATIGEKYGPAMEITDQAEADAYFEELVQHNMANSSHSRLKAEDIEKQNLGYFSGYYDQAVMERVQELFKCVHPIFGVMLIPRTPKEVEQ